VTSTALAMFDGRAPAQDAGRNDPCPCESGRKFKVCCERRLCRMKREDDCARAAMASLAGAPYEETPEIVGAGMFEAWERWAAERGQVLTPHRPDELPVETEWWVLMVGVPAPPGQLQSLSRDGLNRHSIVMRYGEIFHDPLPYRDEKHMTLLAEAEPRVGVTLDDLVADDEVDVV
jgi:hypothetical protein